MIIQENFTKPYVPLEDPELLELSELLELLKGAFLTRTNSRTNFTNKRL